MRLRENRNVRRQRAKQNQQINTTVTPAKGDSSVASGVVSLAYSLLGVPYVSGGSSPSGFDCSGFTYLFRQYGISISRSSSAQAYGGTAVNGLANAQPGDVICYPGTCWIICRWGTDDSC